MSSQEQMIHWWGPIIDEYYASLGSQRVDVDLARELVDASGSVGKPHLQGGVHRGHDAAAEAAAEPGEAISRAGTPFEDTSTIRRKPRRPLTHGWVAVGDVRLSGRHSLATIRPAPPPSSPAA